MERKVELGPYLIWFLNFCMDTDPQLTETGIALVVKNQQNIKQRISTCIAL